MGRNRSCGRYGTILSYISDDEPSFVTRCIHERIDTCPRIYRLRFPQMADKVPSCNETLARSRSYRVYDAARSMSSPMMCSFDVKARGLRSCHCYCSSMIPTLHCLYPCPCSSQSSCSVTKKKKHRKISINV